MPLSVLSDLSNFTTQCLISIRLTYQHTRRQLSVLRSINGLITMFVSFHSFNRYWNPGGLFWRSQLLWSLYRLHLTYGKLVNLWKVGRRCNRHDLFRLWTLWHFPCSLKLWGPDNHIIMMKYHAWSWRSLLWSGYCGWWINDQCRNMCDETPDKAKCWVLRYQ